MLGKHVIADIYGISFKTLDDQEKLARIILDAVQGSGATLLGHHFEPQGCSGIVLVAESHCCWHTWPEHNVLTLDYFTCGTVDPEPAVDQIYRELEGTSICKEVLSRGCANPLLSEATYNQGTRHDDEEETSRSSGLLHRGPVGPAPQHPF